MDSDDLGSPSAGEKALDCVFSAIDEKSRAILWYLWWKRHASISELRDLVGAAQDYDVLRRLTDVINKAAVAALGKPVVAFETSRIDPATGEQVLFSWWFLETEQSALPALDVLEEEGNVTIIAQVQGQVDYMHPEVKYRNGVLQIRLKKLRHS